MITMVTDCLVQFSALFSLCTVWSYFLFPPPNPPISPQHIVDLVKQLADGPYLVAGVDPVNLFDIAKPPAVFRDDARQCRVHAPCGDDVVAGDVFDLFQFVFGLKVAHRDDLDGVFFAVGDVDEHRAEVAHAFACADLFAQVVFVFFGQIGVVGVEDVTRVGAVAVVAAAEQGRGFVEQQRLHAAKVVGDAVDGLFHVVVHDVDDFIGLKVHEFAVGQEHAVTPVDFYPHVDRRQVFELQDFTEGVGVAIQKRVPKHHVVESRAAHGAGAAPRRGDELTQQQVAFELRYGAVVRVGAQQLGQPGARHGGLVDVAVVAGEHPHVLPDVAAQHLFRFPERKRAHGLLLTRRLSDLGLFASCLLSGLVLFASCFGHGFRS